MRRLLVRAALGAEGLQGPAAVAATQCIMGLATRRLWCTLGTCGTDEPEAALTAAAAASAAAAAGSVVTGSVVGLSSSWLLCCVSRVLERGRPGEVPADR
jgi:hypothetical protein